MVWGNCAGNPLKLQKQHHLSHHLPVPWSCWEQKPTMWVQTATQATKRAHNTDLLWSTEKWSSLPKKPGCACQINNKKHPKKLVKNHSPRATLHASVYQDQINLGDWVHLAKKPAPWLVMLVRRDQQGRWGRKGSGELPGCSSRTKLWSKTGKKKIL